MGSHLPDLTLDDFSSRLGRSAPEAVSEEVVRALWAHYGELRRWNPRLSLVGPGTAEEVVERHYGEALAALPLLGDARALLDVGSGGGFPGLVLAAARPELEVTLVEARERKWAFLQAAARRAELSCKCLNARVSAASAITPVDVVTWRAVRLPGAIVEKLATATRRMLVWCGVEELDPPAGWARGRVLALAGSSERRVVEWVAPGVEAHRVEAPGAENS